ncbi:hypothetical protein M5689_020727 [Euphorbia peplus]|nr:hypothetical protein M5689_020727 [Euphorbia peplus]
MYTTATLDDEFPRNYVCETTFFCNGDTDMIEGKKFVGESRFSENLAKDHAACQCLKYLKVNKGVLIMDYNCDALVRKQRQLQQMREDVDNLEKRRIDVHNDKKKALESSFHAATQHLQTVLNLLN